MERPIKSGVPTIIITDDNFLDLAYEYYQNHLIISDEEILEDIAHVKFIRRLIKNYFTKKVINDRLIVNHIIILNNVFDTKFMVELLFHQIQDYEMRVVLKTFLLFLGYVKESYRPEIAIDNEVAKILRAI